MSLHSRLHPILLSRLDQRGLTSPTPIQKVALAPALAGRDILAIAPTGTGKTLAYLLPVLDAILRDKPASGRAPSAGDRLRGLVLCPTRELAMQVAEEARWLTKGSVLGTGVIYGKTPVRPQRAMLEEGVDLVVGTPGRLRDLIDDGSLHTHAITQVVIDEADRMWDMGFAPQVSWILGRLGTERRTICCSATLPAQVEGELSGALRDPVRVEAAPPNTLAHAEPGTHRRYDITDRQKPSLLMECVEGQGRKGVAIYCRTRRRVVWVGEALARHGLAVSILHGDMSQRERTQSLRLFEQGQTRVLVATDVASRGLHIARIKCVVNYDVPLLPEEFVHRVGRAGHGGGVAESLTFVSPIDTDRWARVERLIEGRLVKCEALPNGLARWGRDVSGTDAPDPDQRDGERTVRKAGVQSTRPRFKDGPRVGGERPGRANHDAGRDRGRTFGGKDTKPGRAARAPIQGNPGKGVRKPGKGSSTSK
ncbi:MAG: DEAD/DEAH box helicase [Planctomycetota bacterium]|nr:DEAD/DEAH box helicase [Planctomycetota bacterium]MDA1105409.1 DEAD/DEAH box helicase [Planctomycetota bacterium]